MEGVRRVHFPRPGEGGVVLRPPSQRPPPSTHRDGSPTVRAFEALMSEGSGQDRTDGTLPWDWKYVPGTHSQRDPEESRIFPSTSLRLHRPTPTVVTRVDQ